MKTPEQIAAELMGEAYEFGPMEDGIKSGYLETGAIGRIIVHAIEADRAQRGYVATVQEDGFDPHRTEVFPKPGESIVEAIIDRGNMRTEWVLIDVMEAAR